MWCLFNEQINDDDDDDKFEIPVLKNKHNQKSTHQAYTTAESKKKLKCNIIIMKIELPDHAPFGFALKTLNMPRPLLRWLGIR